MKMKKLLAMVLCIAMVLSMMAFTVSAESTADVWDGNVDTSWYNGTDTEFELTTAEQLAGLAELVNGGNTFEGKTINLGSDLDLSNEVWIPIGTSIYDKTPDNATMFAGNFDGGNHTITGLTSEGYVPASSETVSTEYSFGLFGYVYGANISNVKLADVDIDCGKRNDSDGNEVYGSGVAALIGYYHVADHKTCVIDNCHVLGGTVKASNNMGGLIGYMDSQLTQPTADITIKDCSNAADVTTEAREAGGIIGLMNSAREGNYIVTMRGTITFKNCINTGDITSLGDGAPSAGGILGRDHNQAAGQRLKLIFDGCKNSGAITVTANGETHAAGIAAGYYSNGAWLIAKNCKNTGNVVVNNPSDKVYAGGLISYGGVVELNNSTSTGTVTGGTANNTYVGGAQSILFLEGMYDCTDEVNGYTYYLNGGTSPEYDALVDDAGMGGNFHLVETAYRDNFTFGGWYDNAECTGEAYTKLDKNVKTYYAKWNGTVAKIGDVEYQSLEAAFTAAQDGETITLMADAVPVLKSQKAITKAAVVDLNGNKITLTEDDLYFGTTTFKNGDIVVAPVVKPSTAVFWMFKDQTLTFDNVKLTATGVTGTYLIGLDGNNSDLNLLNGSEIIVENDTALDLDIICVNASEGNDIVIDNSKVNVTNLDGRVFFRGNYTVSGNSDIDLEGITKAGFRIEKGQTLNIADTATVDIVGEPRDGGIHIVELPATYSKADTATVNATVNAPASDAKIEDTEYATLKSALEAANDGDVINLLGNVVIDESTRAHNSGSWYDGVYYIGDKSFTVNLNGYTITHDGSVNDYLLNFKNDGAKANEITLMNGTIDAGTSAYCAICTSSTNTQQITINLENVNLINNNADGATAKIRGGAVLNVKEGTVITGKDSYVGIEAAGSTTVVNIYDGAEIYQNGTSSYVGSLAGVSGGGTLNVYGGYGKSVQGGFIAMTSGGTINVYGGKWIANTDGTYANSNSSVLIAQSNKQYTSSVGNSVVNVEGGTFEGGYNCYGDAVGDAQLIISGGTFNADPSAYVAEGYVAIANPVSGLYEVSGEELVANEISVEFEEVASGSEDEKLFNINLVATSNINEFASAEFTFNNTSKLNDGSVMPYVITPAEKMTLTNPEKGYYGFAMNGVNKFEISGNKITIGQVRFTGYGDIDFNVASGIVNATTVLNNLVKTYTTNGAVSGDITKGDLVINTGVIDTTIAVPTRTLKVNVAFPNAVKDNAAAYQAMKVEITGVIEGKNQTVTYDLGGNMKTDGKYVVTEDRLVLNNAYTVTVSGAGYRTARYTVTMTDSKELKFWNNVMDEEQVVEIGKDTSAVKVTYLAGDIVKDNKINIYDLSAVVSYFGTTTDRAAKDDYVKYDLNRDGVIDSKDVAYVLVSWNN